MTEHGGDQVEATGGVRARRRRLDPVGLPPPPPATAVDAVPRGDGGGRATVVAVVVVVLLVGAGFLALRSGGGGDDTGSARAGVDAVVTDEIDPGAADEEAIDPFDPLDGAEDPFEEPFPTTPSFEPEVTVAPPTTFEAGADDGWAALLVSDPTIGRAEAVAAELQPRVGQTIEVFASADYASLRPGYWVAAIPGFADAEGALRLCRQLGRVDGSSCAARRLLDGPGISWDRPAGSGTTDPDYLRLP